jgi:hypothetical protein
MSDELSSKLKSFVELLSSDDVPDELKGIVGMFKNKLKDDNDNIDNNDDDNISMEKSPSPKSEFGIENIMKFKDLFENSKDYRDHKITLLLAIKPFLNSHRQKRITECISLLKLASMTKLFDGNNSLFK